MRCWLTCGLGNPTFTLVENEADSGYVLRIDDDSTATYISLILSEEQRERLRDVLDRKPARVCAAV